MLLTGKIISVNFGSVAVDEVATKDICIINDTEKTQKYQTSCLYVVNNLDEAFEIHVKCKAVHPGRDCVITVTFKPKISNHSHIEYFLIEDSSKNTNKLIVRGTSFGEACLVNNRPRVYLEQNKMVFTICKGVSEDRTKNVEIINSSIMDAVFQWILPDSGLGYFQVRTGYCGVIQAGECVSTAITYTATSTGTFAGELVCLVQHQEPLFLDVLGTFTLPGNPPLKPIKYLSERHRKRSSYHRLMENSLTCLPYTPSATAFERYLDFAIGSAEEIFSNISRTICVTNQEDVEGYCQWLPDPERTFIIDPIGANISPKTSKLFSVRFRPSRPNLSFGYLLSGFLQIEKMHGDQLKTSYTWFRIPCIGNTWDACAKIDAEWVCQTKIVMPPTVPGRAVFSNFTLSNKRESRMLYEFKPPRGTNFAVMPMCGNLLGRGWQIVSVALEPKCFGYFCENWELLINNSQKVRIVMEGSAEDSHVQVMSHGYNPTTHGMLTFPATITNCCSRAVSHLHNMTRNTIHLRVLNSVSWLGADGCGTLILQPNEIVAYHWWFFPKTPDKVYETTVTCSCLCVLDDQPVGETKEIFISMTGFSEYPKLKVLPRKLNLHDIVVGDTSTFDLTLYNFGTCSLTLKLFLELRGMGDDYSRDLIEVSPVVNSLEPSKHCQVKGTVTPHGAGPREISVRFCVQYHTEYQQLVSLKREEKRICAVWYDGIYPTIQVHRAISDKCPIALTGHCLWNVMNLDELNKAFEDCRPNKPLTVNLFAPDLYKGAGSVEVVLILDCVYRVDVPWSLKRHKLCDCPMVEVQIGISTYEMRHSCIHRPLVAIEPMDGIVVVGVPASLHIKFEYDMDRTNTLGYVLTLPNQRSLVLQLNIKSCSPSMGVLTALRRRIGEDSYLATLDCGRVPINNLDPVVRVIWLYNPTNAFATWRLLREKTQTKPAIRCILFFAEVPPLCRLAIPIAFLPTEMIDYEEVLSCSFGYDIVTLLVKGQGSLPNCVENRLDIPRYIKNNVRAQHRENMVWISHEHITVPVMPTHSHTRELISLTNDTNHVMRFIWLAESIAHIVNFRMTPSWGTLQPKSTQWITMTIYSLQEPTILTVSLVCELFDMTASRQYQRNELLRRDKTELCAELFIITEKGTSYPGINDSPPYVEDLPIPVPFNLAISVAISTQGQRDGCRRMCLRQLLEQTPPCDLQSSEAAGGDMLFCGYRITYPRMPLADVLRIIDNILWDALHSKMMKSKLQYYSKEKIPTYSQLMGTIRSGEKPELSKGLTAGICDAIVHQAVFDVFSLKPKHHFEILKL